VRLLSLLIHLIDPCRIKLLFSLKKCKHIHINENVKLSYMVSYLLNVIVWWFTRCL